MTHIFAQNGYKALKKDVQLSELLHKVNYFENWVRSLFYAHRRLTSTDNFVNDDDPTCLEESKQLVK